MSLQVREEDVLPQPARCGARLDSSQIDVLGIERFERASQRASLMRRGKHQAGLVAARCGSVFPGEDDESSGVLLTILSERQNGQTVELSCERACDSGGSPLLRRPPR